VRDTAAFVDACRGPAPGEFMPFWTSPELYTQLITHDPGRLRIALSHQWGDYRATPHIAAELKRVGWFLEDLGHHVDYVLPDIDYRTAFAAQTTCYISNFAQVIGNLLAARARAATGGSCRTCQHTDLGDRPAHDICRASAHPGGLQHDFAWLRRIL